MKHAAWGLVMATGKTEQITADIETAFLYLNDRPVLAYTLTAFSQCPEIEGIVVVVSRERAESVLGMVQMFGFAKVKKIVVGGAKRAASMAAGLEHVAEEVDLVCIHDASRPMVTPALIAETIKSARRHGSGVAAQELADPVVAAKKGVAGARLDKDGPAWAVITPQTWPRAALVKAYPRAVKDRKNHEDDLAAMSAQRLVPRLVPASGISLRIRSAEDLAPALALMK
jgi:2-C-methyl-D-erythritol 4-phosphate cytidylyltransferase